MKRLISEESTICTDSLKGAECTIVNFWDMERVFRFKDAEAWDLTINEKRCRLMIMDLRRPPSQEDYPYLNEDIESRENHIKCHIVTPHSLDAAEKDELCSIIGVFLSHVAQAHCSWNIEFYENQRVEHVTKTLLSAITSHSPDELNFTFFSQD
ncbi:hypothetical protein [Brevibacillus sp. MCWH]|jgi:hypothetical protein|uniref:hypothetical protein n=2 Tax=unclassified Brevibacillus TaxID=2684853 RepID=UPI001491C14B|nr:hypothetical protein [Brevibacillus sp. MCWH]MBR8660959.1 hypothetical protein [Brevibacillus sp. NL20B1]NNV01141.1 hypothetical protein [Brevibacillus sp. MCWH]